MSTSSPAARPASVRPRPRFWCSGAALLLVFLTSLSPVLAAVCGDDVDGVDVPCACGDIVVSSVVLGDDPVVAEPCPRDGLVVRLPRGRESMTLHLNGHVLRGGTHGTGVRVVDGGRFGARIVGQGGRIEGFRDAVVAQSANGIASIHGLRIVQPRRDGIRVVGKYGDLSQVEVVGAGRDGIFVRGTGWWVSDVQSNLNGRDGMVLMGYDHRAGDDAPTLVTNGNGRSGIRLWGHRHAVESCRSRGNGSDGIYLNGYALEVYDCRTDANASAGISGNASGARLAHNVADDNLRQGIVLHGHGVEDAGGNRAVGSDDAGACRLGLVECR